MNKVLTVISIVLIVAVAYLFLKISSLQSPESKEAGKTDEKPAAKEAPPEAPKGNAPTGKIAYVNIDKLNEESLEIKELKKESEAVQRQIEASLESLNKRYQEEVESYQNSQKAGIIPESELLNKEKRIVQIQKEAQQKQIQRDELADNLAMRSAALQKKLQDVVNRWNNSRFDYVFSYSEAVPTIIYGNASMDITSDIIAEMNSDYTKLKNEKQTPKIKAK